MAITIVSHTGAGSTNDTDVTTAAIDTTGATAIVVAMTNDASTTANTLSDSFGNTPTGLTVSGAGAALPRVRLFYYSVPTVGATHTFSTSTVAASYPCLFVLALSGVGSAATEIDSVADSAGSFVTALAATGPVTPAVDNEIIICGLGLYQAVTSPLISGFTIADTFLPNTHTIPGGLAYVIQTTAGAVTPTWTWSTSSSKAALAILSLKAGASGVTFVGRPPGSNRPFPFKPGARR